MMRSIKGTLFALVGAAATWPAATLATNYVVNDPGDAVAMDGVVTLREALQAANSDTAAGDAAAGEADGDTISFDATAFAVSPLITLSGSALVVADDVAIDGALPSGVILVSANSTSRVFEVDTANALGASATVTLSNLVLDAGMATTSGGALSVAAGAEVALSMVDIQNSAAAGTLATEGGGGIYVAGSLDIDGGTIALNAANAGSGSGGGIFVEEGATLDVVGTTFSENVANRAGGAIEARAGSSVTLTDVTMTMNSAGDVPGNGGGLHITGNGTAVISGGTYSQNIAALEGGALWNGSGSMLIDGSSSAVVIDANQALGAAADDGGGGVFNNGGIVTIAGDVTISNNMASGAAGSGGGIFNATGGSLAINGATITANSAVRAGGGIEDASGAGTTVDLVNVTLTANTTGSAPGNGGGLHITGDGEALISGGTISGNVAASEGGGLWNGTGLMTIDGSTTAVLIDANTASGDAADNGGGGVFNAGGSVDIVGDVTISNNIADGISGSGGGVLSENGSFSANGTVISSNRANRAGGGIETAGQHSLTLVDVMLSGNNAGVDPAIAAPGNGGAVHISGTGSADISGGAVMQNLAASEGGGLWNQLGTTMTVTGVQISANDAAGIDASNGGGGIFNNGGELIVAMSTISNNTATQGSGSGGGLMNDGGAVLISDSVLSANSAVRAGGAIEDRSTDTSTSLTVLRSTLDGNSTGANPGNGGGLHITGSLSLVTVDQSTVSANSAANEGGGLWNFGGSTLLVANSTVSGNNADGTGGGGIFVQPNGFLELYSVTVAANTAVNVGGGLLTDAGGSSTATNSLFGDNSAATDNDVSGALTASFSLIETVDGDLALDALASNGGPTQTHALLAGSIAIDAGSDADCMAAPVNGIDQRGVTRPMPCDIGAFEIVDGPVVTASSNAGGSASTRAGATDVSAVAFTFASGADEGTLVAGFSGTIEGTAVPENAISGIRVYLDANADGVLDAGETELTGAGGATASVNGTQFSVSFDPARAVLASGDESYLVVIDISSSAKALVLAAGLPLLLLLAWPVARGGARRRLWLALPLAGLLSAGCSGGGIPLTAPPPTLQFSVTDINATGANSGEQATVTGLPFTGPVIEIR